MKKFIVLNRLTAFILQGHATLSLVPPTEHYSAYRHHHSIEKYVLFSQRYAHLSHGGGQFSHGSFGRHVQANGVGKPCYAFAVGSMSYCIIVLKARLPLAS